MRTLRTLWGSSIVRSLVQLIISIWIIGTVIFVVFRIIPGDPAAMTLGLEASEQQREFIREQMGLNDPIIVQYGRWMANLLRGDLGVAYSRGGMPVADIVWPALGRTLLLATYAIVIAAVASIVAGVQAAARQNRFFDHVSRWYALAAFAIPGFWLAILMILVFAVGLGWFPTSGYISPGESLWGHIRHAVLPVVTIAILVTGVFIRFVRTAMISELREPYIRTARAKGANGQRILYRHALKNALIPFVTVAGLEYGRMIGGLLIVEFIFAWPGLGWTIINAVNGRQFDVAQVAITISAAALVAVSMFIDVLYRYLDPRIGRSA